MYWRKTKCFITFFLVIVLIVGSSPAAAIEGSTWTGSPKRILGIVFGYYCTAAQNKSANGIDRKASAYSKRNGEKIAEAKATGNDRAVANSGFLKPTKGRGEYSEKDGAGFGDFGPGAYKDY